MSIHKSEGQMIEQAKIDLQSVFEEGKSYVALSRAASLEGLQVLGFDPKKVRSRVVSLVFAEWNGIDEERAGQGAPEGDRVEFELGDCCGSYA